MSLGENFNAEGIDERYEAFMADNPESYRTKPKQDEELRYYTKKDVMEMFQVSLPTVDNWLRDGVLEKTLIGPKLVRFSKAQIEKLITENGVPHA